MFYVIAASRIFGEENAKNVEENWKESEKIKK